MESDAAYFRRRASEEYFGHANADDSAAGEIHLELAKRYDDLARSIEQALHSAEDGRTGGEELIADSEKEVLQQASLWL